MLIFYLQLLQTPLFLAVTAGQTWLTKMLVQQMGADCNAHSLLEVCYIDQYSTLIQTIVLLTLL